ncbi:MAG: sugar ABC transporter ATP-binding protein [Acidobacteriota bacterium]
MTVLSLVDVSKRFGPTLALDGVHLELERGQVHALVGENGAGKSTLMGILAGALQPDEGKMWLHRAPFSPSSPFEARKQGVSLIHQEPSLCPHLSVAENILLGIESSSWGWLRSQADRARAQEVLQLFEHPELGPDRIVGDLSLPARQIVEICRALSFPSDILLMDEPTSALQRGDVQRLFALIRDLASRGTSVIYISHFLEEVREVADVVTILRDGKGVGCGRLEDFTDDALIASMVGRPVAQLFPAPARLPGTDGEVVLEVTALCAPPALEQVSLELRRGEVLGIAGLAGSGRTPLVRAIFGLDPVASGRIRVQSKSLAVHHIDPSSQIRQGVGYLSEDRKGEGVALSLSIADNLTLTRFSSCARRGWIDLAAQERQAGRRVEQLQIKARSARQPVSHLSGGNQQKVALGRLLHQDADLFLLDEPTRGVDIGSRVQIYQVIAQLAACDRAVLLVSSYLPELFGLCHRLAVMREGRLSKAQPIQEWTPETVLRAALGQ